MNFESVLISFILNRLKLAGLYFVFWAFKAIKIFQDLKAADKTQMEITLNAMENGKSYLSFSFIAFN